MALPLTVDELGAALAAIGGFERRPFVAVAVSGGPDSLALTILGDRWARARDGEVCALTVDHRLRPESAAEAELVAGWCAERAIRHETLFWEGEKPATGIQEAAREARYRLLAGWCREHGCLHLLTAHHREDQAETYLIRRRAGSGVDGLAAMSAVREICGCRVVRPLLGTPRARLAALLEAERQPFITDPSNSNPRFERARLRAENGGATSSALDDAATQARSCGMERIHRERDLDALSARAVSLHPAGFATLEPEPIRDAPPERAERLLGRVAATIGGARYPLRRDRVARLLAGLLTEPQRARTLGGCRFVPWRGRILVLREMAAAASPQGIEPGDTILWDRRFEVALPQEAERPVTIGYLGGRRTAMFPPSPPASLPGLVRPVLPAVWNEPGLLAVPDLWCRPGDDSALPRLAFRPANPLSQAGFTVV
jgi:tRNA(Ile)-lysidine synthase